MMATCKAPRSAAPGLRERLSLNLVPINLLSTRVGYAAAWGNGPLSAGAIPSTSPEWSKAFVPEEYELDQPPPKRIKTGCEVEVPHPKDIIANTESYKSIGSTEPSFITSDELADMLKTPLECSPDDCASFPVVLDLRSLPAQMCFRIEAAIGMPCESRVKMRLVLPHLDNYLHGQVTDVCPHCGGALKEKKQLVVLYTETGSEHAPVWEGLRLHLTRTHGVDVRLLKGGFREFRRTHPQLCEKTFGRLSTARTGSGDDNCRSSSTPTGQLNQAPSSSPNPDFPLDRSTEHRLSGSASCNSFLLPGLTFSFENVNGINGLGSPSSSIFPRYLVSPITVRSSSEFLFPNEEDQRTPKDVFRIKASRILPFLYLGNEIDCSSEQFLDSCRIRSVLNVTTKVPFLDETRYRCCRLPAVDIQTQDLRPLFTSAFEFIEQSREAGDSVLVHCQAGVSRSPAFVIAYLMAHSGLSLREAYRWVKSKRSVISPNFAFLGQLCDFEADLVAGRVPRKPETLNGLIPQLEESREVDDFLSLSIDNYNAGARASPVETTESLQSTNRSESTGE
ncbi:unnamed protein product [Echinostoma caproni]|uniref:protein-tyrosine-phosphatase n=1 Tax=Echinostoma caproni TaxID=27848 RepID=A0A183A5H8_9TREM|nr:unnamed protein product [Echinostoma caproni]